MSYYINLPGKMLLAAGGLLGLTKVAGKYLENRGEDTNQDNLGLPKDVYDTLKGHTFTGDRKAYMEHLNTIGAPTDSSFRMNLWKALGGK